MQERTSWIIAVFAAVVLVFIIGYGLIKEDKSLNEDENGNANVPPMANAGNNQTVYKDDRVSFSGSAIDDDGYIVKYEWDFEGNGIYEWSNVSTGDTHHIYNTTGTYIAVFKVTDNNGATDTDTCTITVKEKTASANAEIVDHNSYTTEGTLTVVGVVNNTGSINLEQVVINGTFYNNQDDIIGYATTSAMLRIITPNQQSPFKLKFSEHPEYDHYILALSFTETTTQPYTDLNLQAVDGHPGVIGEYYISGEVQNTGADAAELVEVVVTVFDSNDKVIETSISSVNPDILASGETGVFEFEIDTNPLPETIDHYIIQTQGTIS